MGDLKYIYQSIFDKTCFQYELAYGDFKDFPRKTITIKLLLDKMFNTAKNPKYYGYERGLSSIFIIFLDNKTSNTKKEQ